MFRIYIGDDRSLRAAVFSKLVTGRAARIHVPFGGQGMNETGLRDIWNLGWKLVVFERRRNNHCWTLQFRATSGHQDVIRPRMRQKDVGPKRTNLFGPYGKHYFYYIQRVAIGGHSNSFRSRRAAFRTRNCVQV